MTSHRHQTDATKRTVAVIIIAVVIAIQELYVSGNDGILGLLLLLIPVLILSLKIRKKSPWFNEQNPDTGAD